MFDEIVFEKMVADMASIDAAPLSRPELCDRLAALGRVRSAVDAAEARCVEAIDTLGDSGADAATVLRSTTKCSARTAKARSRRGTALADMPTVAELLASGRLNAESADVLVAAAEETTPAAVEQDDALLRLVESRPADLSRREAARWIARKQTNADREARFAAQVAKRDGQCFPGEGGMTVLHAQFDPITGTRILKRVDREADLLWRHDGGRDGRPDEVRSPGQRRADAIARVFGLVRADDPPVQPPGRGASADSLIVVAEVGVIDGTNPEGRCEIVDVGPVPASILQTLSPNTIVRGALFDGEGRPLWLGRKQRLASTDQRLILAIRDGGCRYCSAKTWQCHAHHIDDFNGPNRGRTDVDQMELVCPGDHTVAHTHPGELPRSGLWDTTSEEDGEPH